MNQRQNLIHLNHSQIVNYPPDYEIFPLAKKARYIKIVLKKNEFCFIPRSWYHWIITEPKTIAVSYSIDKFEGNELNSFYEHENKNIPFNGIGSNFNLTNYGEFICDNSSINFNGIISSNNDCSPVYKNNSLTHKIRFNGKLEDIYNLSANSNLYYYIGQNHLEKSLHDKYSKISKYINFGSDISIEYDPYLWISFDKQINSGLHNDATSNLMFVIDGQKTIYLYPPCEKKYLYIEQMDGLLSN